MLFYRAKGIVADKKWAEENNDRRVRQENAHLIENKSAAFNRDYRKKAYFFVTDVSGDGATVGIICREKKTSLFFQLSTLFGNRAFYKKSQYAANFSFFLPIRRRFLLRLGSILFHVQFG